MQALNKPLIFLCSGATKAGSRKLSYRVAAQLAEMGIGEIATLQDLSAQHLLDSSQRANMIFINDCKSGCVNVLTHGFAPETYIFLDVSPFRASEDFNISHYIQTEILAKLNDKWPDRFVSATAF